MTTPVLSPILSLLDLDRSYETGPPIPRFRSLHQVKCRHPSLSPHYQFLEMLWRANFQTAAAQVPLCKMGKKDTFPDRPKPPANFPNITQPFLSSHTSISLLRVSVRCKRERHPLLMSPHRRNTRKGRFACSNWPHCTKFTHYDCLLHCDGYM